MEANSKPQAYCNKRCTPVWQDKQCDGFRKKNYRHVVYLDFREHPEYRNFFIPNLDIPSIILRISATMPDVEIEAKETCFVFDEIQDCLALVEPLNISISTGTMK